MCFGVGMYEIAFFAGCLMYAIEAFFPKLYKPVYPRNLIKICVRLNENGRTSDVNEVLNTLKYKHSENRLHKDEEGGWILETEIATHSDFDPVRLKEEMAKNANITDVEIL